MEGQMKTMSAADYQSQIAKPARDLSMSNEEFVQTMKGEQLKHALQINQPAKHIPLEKDIQTAILNRLGLVQEAFFWRENSGMVQAQHKGKNRSWRAGIKGISDIMGVYKGIFIAIEVKRPGKKVSMHQQAFMNRVRECGGVAFVCDDDSLVVERLNSEYMKACDALPE